MKYPWAMIRLSALGDALLTTGVLEYWHKRHDMTFHVLTRPAFAPLFGGHPAVERVTALEGADLTFSGLRRLAHRLSGETAGLVDLHGTVRSAVLGCFWKGEVRRYPKFRLERKLFLATRGRVCSEKLEALNVPQRYALALEQQAPSRDRVRPVLYLQPEEIALADSRLSGSRRPRVALHPYAAHASKTWPAAHWASLARMLRERGLDCLVLGQHRQPLALTGERDFTNKTTLRESAALNARADVLVTGDSGPMHLASAVGTPVVALFGPTAKAWGFMPSGERDTILQRELPCRPCSLHGDSACRHDVACMREITPDVVCEAVLKCLDRG